METEKKGRVAAGCLAAVAICGQALAGLFYVATYTPEPIGGGGGYSGRSDGLPHSGAVHALIIVSGIVGILATIMAARKAQSGSSWPHRIGIVSAVIGFLATGKMAHDLSASGGGLATLSFGFAVNLLMGVTAASAIGFIAVWPRRDGA